MADDRTDSISQIHEDIRRLTTIKTSQLVQKERLGQSLALDGIAAPFERIKTTLSRYGELPIEELPEDHLATISNHVQNALSLVETAENFEPADSESPARERDTIIQQFTQQAARVWKQNQALQAYLMAYSNFTGGGSEARLAEAEDRLRRLREMEEKAASTTKQMRHLLAASREAATDTGVSKHAEIFERQADTHATAANRWLMATSIAAIATAIIVVIFVVIFTSIPETTDTLTKSIRTGLASLTIVSLFAAATVWCGQTYRFQRHNELVSRHRANSLATFQAFVEGASDDVRDVVLIQATQSIFVPQETGFSGGQTSGPAIAPMPLALDQARTGLRGIRDREKEAP